MAKELPYFRFTSQEWQNGLISLESYHLKGLFIDVCAYYWVQDCSVTETMINKKFNCEKELKELYDLEIIKVNKKREITILFLDEQFDLLSNKRKIRQLAGSKGGKQKSSNATAMLQQKSSYKDKDNDKDNKPQTPKGDSFDFDKLIVFFNSTFKKQSRVVSDKVKKKYKLLLKSGYTKEDVQIAMMNAEKDSFHIDSGFKHTTIEFFSRPETIDKFINFKPKDKQYPVVAWHNSDPLN